MSQTLSDAFALNYINGLSFSEGYENNVTQFRSHYAD